MFESWIWGASLQPVHIKHPGPGLRLALYSVNVSTFCYKKSNSCHLQFDYFLTETMWSFADNKSISVSVCQKIETSVSLLLFESLRQDSLPETKLHSQLYTTVLLKRSEQKCWSSHALGVSIKHFRDGRNKPNPLKLRYRYHERFQYEGSNAMAKYSLIEITFMWKLFMNAFWESQVPRFGAAALRPRSI